MNRTALTLFALTALFAFAGLVEAEAPTAKGQAAYQRGDYVTAFKEWRKLAEEGNAFAQNNLAVMYDEGTGAPKDHEEAAKWYRRAAEQGHHVAQFNLGVLYANGLGVEQDYKEAAKWYRRAAEQGDASAQFNLGVLYANGTGLEQNDVEALAWVTLAGSIKYYENRFNEVEQARSKLRERMTPEQIAEAERLANVRRATRAKKLSH